MPAASRLYSVASGFTFASFLGTCILWDFLLRLDFLAGMVFLPVRSIALQGGYNAYMQKNMPM